MRTLYDEISHCAVCGEVIVAVIADDHNTLIWVHENRSPDTLAREREEIFNHKAMRGASPERLAYVSEFASDPMYCGAKWRCNHPNNVLDDKGTPVDLDCPHCGRAVQQRYGAPGAHRARYVHRNTDSRYCRATPN